MIAGFGARGGLAARTFEIRTELDTRARYLDKVFNFGQLLVSAHISTPSLLVTVGR